MGSVNGLSMRSNSNGLEVRGGSDVGNLCVKREHGRERFMVVLESFLGRFPRRSSLQFCAEMSVQRHKK